MIFDAQIRKVQLSADRNTRASEVLVWTSKALDVPMVRSALQLPKQQGRRAEPEMTFCTCSGELSASREFEFSEKDVGEKRHLRKGRHVGDP